jgi:hypothetical protein
MSSTRFPSPPHSSTTPRGTFIRTPINSQPSTVRTFPTSSSSLLPQRRTFATSSSSSSSSSYSNTIPIAEKVKSNPLIGSHHPATVAATQASNAIVYSDEQKAVATALKEGNNVIIQAVAGSGKTTTICHVVDELSYSGTVINEIGEPEASNILVLLYNKRLADETNKRIKNSNVKIGTIHALAQSLYNVQCRNDNGIKQILDNDIQYRGIPYDIVVVDEMQDVTLLLARLLLKIIRDCQPFTLLFMGDDRQCIYKFMEADPRFLTMADTIFGPLIINNVYDESKLNDKWLRLNLSQTYRCSKPVVDFVNHVLLKEDKMIAHKMSGYKPDYIVCEIFKVDNEINMIIDDYLKQGNKQEDIAILGQSLKSAKSPINRVCNYLSSKGKLIDKKSEDDYGNDSRVSENKIVVSTFHCFKGLERKMIIIIGFDAGFYIASNKESKEVCPNVLYVACTRAKERLLLFQDETNGPLPFLNTNLLHEYANVIGIPKATILPDIQPKNKSYTVTDLIKFIPHTVYDELKTKWEETVVPDLKGNSIDLSTIIPFTQKSTKKQYYESVSNIYGSAIPLLKQYELTSDMILYDLLLLYQKNITDLGITPHAGPVLDERDKLIKQYSGNGNGNSNSKTNITTNGNNQLKTAYENKFPRMINIYQCIIDRYIHPLNQITNYDWYFSQHTQSGLHEGVKRLNFLTANDVFEKSIAYSKRIKTIDENYVDTSVVGAIDCISHAYGPIEFKFVNDFDINHILQVVVYACMLYLREKKTDDFCLFNIRTGDMLKIRLKNPAVEAEIIMTTLIKHKLLSSELPVNMTELLSKLSL